MAKIVNQAKDVNEQDVMAEILNKQFSHCKRDLATDVSRDVPVRFGEELNVAIFNTWRKTSAQISAKSTDASRRACEGVKNPSMPS